MKTAKKILALLLCAVLLVGASIAGTLAYLTSKDEVTNTFTVGEVNIELNENDYDGDNDTKRNTYSDVVPGVSYKKEPVVTVKENSADCYVRAQVTVTFPGDAADYDKLCAEEEEFAAWAARFATVFFLTGDTSGFNSENWNLLLTDVDTTAMTAVYTLTYRTDDMNIVQKNAAADTVLEPIFTAVRFPRALTSEQISVLDDLKIDVEAHAIQAEGFATETEAWEAFDVQNN